MSTLRKILPWRVRLLVIAVALAAGGLSAYTTAPLERPEPSVAVMILVFGLLAAMSHFRPTWSLNQQSTYNTVPAAYFAMAMVLPAPLIPLVIAASWLPWSALRVRTNPARLVEVCFNLSTDVVAGVLARLVYDSGRTVLAPTLALLMSAVVFVAIQTALVSTIVVLYRRISYREVDGLKAASLSAELTTVIVGGITALLYQVDAWSLAVIFVPLSYLQYMIEKVQNQQAAFLDAKTGVFNYRYLDERLPKEVERAKMTGAPLSVVFADLDFLREVNNTHGHLVGDLAIRHVAQVLKGCLADNQFCARFGGEEFVMVLPQVDLAGALRLAETARGRVAESAIRTGDLHFNVTMSFGVAVVPDDATTVRDLVHAADTAVYQAKEGGRNCVRAYRKGESMACAASR